MNTVELLKNKVALVTGAASGIGEATAKLFAQQGAKVVLADINEAGGRAAAEAINDASGESLFVPTDVTKMDQCARVVEQAVSHFGKLDIMHSNAAALAMGSATELTEEGWDFTQNACLKSTWMMAHHAVPRILEAGGGVIVITGSLHALRGYSHYAAYQAAKGGLYALTRSLAADYAPDIRVNTILAGAVVTGLWVEIAEADREKIARAIPLQRNGSPEDIARAALFLVSDWSSYMTGESIVVDGGLSSIMPFTGATPDDRP